MPSTSISELKGKLSRYIRRIEADELIDADRGEARTQGDCAGAVGREYSRRREDLLDEREKRGTVDRLIEDRGRVQAVDAQISHNRITSVGAGA